MHRFAIIGESLPHTYSPLIHSQAIKLLGLDAAYKPIEIPSEQFVEQIGDLKASKKYNGFNVTIPYKTRIISVLDQIDDEARSIGAVNTIQVNDNQWSGYNTDVTGFLSPLKGLNRKIDSVLILGAGGSARAVIYALVTHLRTHTIILSVRNEQRATPLLEDLSPFIENTSIRIQTLEYAESNYTDFDMVVNTTPLGMYPEVEARPIQLTKKTRREIIFYDLIYNPLKTNFLNQAEAMCTQATLIGGLDMLISQAAYSFTIWTGIKFPEAAVKNHMQSVLT